MAVSFFYNPGSSPHIALSFSLSLVSLNLGEFLAFCLCYLTLLFFRSKGQLFKKMSFNWSLSHGFWLDSSCAFFKQEEQKSDIVPLAYTQCQFVSILVISYTYMDVEYRKKSLFWCHQYQYIYLFSRYFF